MRETDRWPVMKYETHYRFHELRATNIVNVASERRKLFGDQDVLQTKLLITARTIKLTRLTYAL